MPQSHSLDRISVESPCNADWDSMSGNNQVRFCEHCNLQVTDLSSLTRSGAMRFAAQSQGRICVRFIQRADGSVLTGAPEKLYSIGRRVSRVAAGVFTATLSVSSAMAQTRPSPARQPTDAAELAITTGDLQVAADEFSGRLAGTIKTAEGAPVSAATVVLVDRETGEERNTISSPAGGYLFQFLPAGDYLLWVRKPDFETSTNDFHLNANSTLRQDIELRDRARFVTMGAMTAFAVEASPLMKAVTEEDLEKVRRFAFSSSNLNESNPASGNSILAEAVERGNRDIVSVLLSAGADVNQRNSWGRTALMSLADKASVGLVRDLVFAGAKLNARDDSGNNALMNAAGSSNVEVLGELIKMGAQVDAANASGETALFLAARGNSVEAMDLLISAGVNVNARNDEGQTALMTIGGLGDFDKTRSLIAHGARIDLTDDDGRTLLMLAAMNEDPRLAQLLIEAGLKIDARDREGSTALMMAAERGSETTVSLLIQAGAEVNGADKHKRNALMAAALNGQTENVRVLLRAGADDAAKDADGLTALALIRDYGNSELVELLKSRGAPK